MVLAGPIIVACSRFFKIFFSCIFLPSSVMVMGPCCFVCIVVGLSDADFFAYHGDLSFAFLCCFVFL